MAELMANKSSNVVSNNSNKKNNDVCSVQSNNGLIDLDNITASNNQLITMCDEPENNDDDDLIMTKNTENNELSAEEKSLQEMIESELALRICSANEEEDLINADDDEDVESMRNQPEITIKKIILEPRQDPMDINAEFIGAEMEHYAIVQDPYTYRNGHTTSPDSGESRSPERPEIIATVTEFTPKDKYQHNQNDDFFLSTSVKEQPSNIRVIEEPVFSSLEKSEELGPEDQVVVEDEILVQSKSESGFWPNSETFQCIKTTTNSSIVIGQEAVDKVIESRIIISKQHHDKNNETESVDEAGTWIDSQVSKNVTAVIPSNDNRDLDSKDVWLQDPSSTQRHFQVGQFSDDFDGVTCRQEEAHQSDFQVNKTNQTLQEISAEDTNNYEKDCKNLLADAQDTCNEQPEIEPMSEKDRQIFFDNIVDVDRVVEETQKNSESCTSGDSLKFKILPLDLTENFRNVDEQKSEEIISTNCFIGEECKALLTENKVKAIKKNNGQFKVDNEKRNTNELSEEDDLRLEQEKDVRVFHECGKLYLPTEHHGQDEQQGQSEASWMTVEEATNDRNKLAETINGLDKQQGIKEMSDETDVIRANDVSVEGEFQDDSNTETCTINKTTNGLETVTNVETEINFVASTTHDEDDNHDLSHNTTKIDSLLSRDTTTTAAATTTTTTRLLMSNNDTVAPLTTPDDESSEFSNMCDKESREEVTTSSTVVTSTISTKTSTKTKKKKIEGVAGNDASPTLTPRTKKTKKSKKNDLEKENISVNINTEDPSMHMAASRQMSHQEVDDFSDEDDLSNVNVKSLTQSYVSETSRGEQEKSNKEVIETGVSIKQLCRSFGDISNMTDVDQAAFGISEHTSETQEKAKSMDDLRLCQREVKKLAKDATVFLGVSVKALRASYCSLANLTRAIDEEAQDQAQVNRLKFEKSSFNKFDALSKKSVLHVRSVDAGKVQQQLNSVGQNGDANSNCRSCGKVVFQMEQTKAEGLVWHKNCFRCVQCSKQLNVDNYQSHESTLYCKAHFKELFQPKPVEESDQPVRPRKPEMIIRENQPKELPPDVVRASDKPDLGLEELSSLNVKSRFQVFEKSTNDTTNEIERSPSQVVKRSPSILSKLAKFQAKGMDIGVADDSLNGIPYEESSESEEEEEIEDSEELDSEIVKSKRTIRERPISFTKMDDIKNRWECTTQQGRRESQREARKEEIAGIRSRLFMGKQGKMKEMYQQAVAESERVTKINPTEEIQASAHARSIKERFERGEPIATSDGEEDSKLKHEKPDEEVIAAGISRKSRSLFLELDASAAKTGRPVTPVNPKTPTDVSRRARDAFMGRQVSDDVVRSTDTTEEVQVETSDISNKFKFFESYKEPTKERKQFRITPPRDGQVKQMSSPEREIYRDPDVVRAEDRVDEVVHTDTARKMLSIFRQMEEKATKEDIPDGPKPLKRFTPPPEDKFAKATASESEDDEEEEGEESEGEESGEDRDPNYVRASDKVEDEFLKQAQNAARAKTLRAKFEHWETTDGKVTSHHVAEMDMAQGNGDQASIESASSLRARFESLGSQQPLDSPRAAKVKVNRFVEIQTISMDVCESCQKKVYPLEKVETNNKIFHKQCFRCLQCNCVLRMDTFTLNNGKLYCIPHFKQLFIARGNYDEGFGVDPHKNKWATNNANSTSAAGSGAIAVSNGRATSVANRV